MSRWRLILPLLAMAGCTPDHPFDQPGTWSIPAAGGANDANLRVMVANPGDLVAGVGEENSLGAEAAPPVARLLSGKRTPLLNLDTVDFNLIGAPETPPPNPGGSTAGQ